MGRQPGRHSRHWSTHFGRGEPVDREGDRLKYQMHTLLFRRSSRVEGLWQLKAGSTCSEQMITGARWRHDRAADSSVRSGSECESTSDSRCPGSPRESYQRLTLTPRPSVSATSLASAVILELVRSLTAMKCRPEKATLFAFAESRPWQLPARNKLRVSACDEKIVR